MFAGGTRKLAYAFRSSSFGHLLVIRLQRSNQGDSSKAMKTSLGSDRFKRYSGIRKIGSKRLETLCIPLLVINDISTWPGIQIGLGMNFQVSKRSHLA